jgi:hypothetical protein
VKLSSCKAAILALGLALVAATAPQSLAGQNAAQAPSAKPPENSTNSEKAKLTDATRVSTEEAARRAAQEKAKQTGKEDSKKKADAKKETPAGVTELQPATQAKDDSTHVLPAASQDSGKLPLKDIHGGVQGGGGSGVREGGGDLGASSKGGKTHVYVETERSRSDAATPH